MLAFDNKTFDDLIKQEISIKYGMVKSRLGYVLPYRDLYPLSLYGNDMSSTYTVQRVW